MRFQKMYPAMLVYVLFLAAVGLLLDDPRNILPGLRTIALTQDVLITDYIEIAGIGATFVNSALVTLISIVLLYLAKDPLNGFTLVEMGLMSGFALFGKNYINILPILFGSWLYAKVKREPFGKYLSVGLLGTALSPLVTFMAFGSSRAHLIAGVLMGVLVGFVLPPLASYTFTVQNGMNLYNVGFACGLLAMMLVPVMTALGDAPTRAFYWSTGNNLPFGLILGGLCAVLTLGGLFLCGRPPWAVWAGYRKLLKTSGRAPSDYLRMAGAGPTLVNMGINGLIATGVILLTGGDLNGPTMGGILTIIGFSALGKHAFNIVPIIAGVLLGSLVMQWSITDPSAQIAVMFCTTLAPFAGYFGWPFGILAGFLHSAVVLRAGFVVEGVNLYNNGFSGGLIAMVLFPVIMAVFKHRRPVLQLDEYFDMFEDDSPVTITEEHLSEEEGHRE